MFDFLEKEKEEMKPNFEFALKKYENDNEKTDLGLTIERALYVFNDIKNKSKPQIINIKRLESLFSHLIRTIEFTDEDIFYLNDFIETLFYFDCDVVVINVINGEMDYIKEKIKNDILIIKETIYKTNKGGDKALFVKNDYRKAIKLYGLFSEIVSNYSNNTNDINIEIVDIMDEIELYSSIENQEYFDTPSIYYSYGINADLINEYSEMIYEFEDEKKYENIFDFLDKITRDINNIEKTDIKNLRLFRVLKSNLLDRYLYDYLIGIVVKKIESYLNDDRRKLIIEKIKKCKNAKYSYITKYVINSDKKHIANLYPNIHNFICIMYLTMQIKELLICNNTLHDDKKLFYTSYDTLTKMFPYYNKENKDNIGKLSIMNFSYMNDPTEGKLLNEYIYSDISNDTKERSVLSFPDVYLKCFTNKKDDLPMWEMYGDRAKGCCLVIDWAKTCERSYEKIPIYNVCYVKLENGELVNGNADKNVNFEKILEIVNDIKTIVNNFTSNSNEILITKTILGEVLYLFKDANYSHECETRILLSSESIQDENKEIVETKSFPKLLIRADFNIYIDEIILGPKFENIEEVGPFLQNQLKEMNNIIYNRKDTKIIKSSIIYR